VAKKKSFTKVDRGLHVGPIKNLKENKKLKNHFFSPTHPTKLPPPPVMPAAGQP
jgi:hypothetical protein